MLRRFISKKYIKPWPRGNRAFTLVELLVVISIIGILSTVVFASFSNAKAKSRDAKRISELNQIALALELYFGKYGYYPQAGGPYDVTNFAYSNDSGSNWTNLGSALSEFLPFLPKDPINNCVSSGGRPPWQNLCYSYAYGPVGNSVYPSQYDLTTKFESSNHPLGCGYKDYKHDLGVDGSPNHLCDGYNGVIFGPPYISGGPNSKNLYEVSPI